MKEKKEKKHENKKGKKESLEERVHRHLNDINSEITDEDIRNVGIDLGDPQEPDVKTEAGDDKLLKEQKKSR